MWTLNTEYWTSTVRGYAHSILEVAIFAKCIECACALPTVPSDGIDQFIFYFFGFLLFRECLSIRCLSIPWAEDYVRPYGVCVCLCVFVCMVRELLNRQDNCIRSRHCVHAAFLRLSAILNNKCSNKMWTWSFDGIFSSVLCHSVWLLLRHSVWLLFRHSVPVLLVSVTSKLHPIEAI